MGYLRRREIRVVKVPSINGKTVSTHPVFRTPVCSLPSIQHALDTILRGDVDLNYCNNVRIFRYAETLLNYAEMLTIHGQDSCKMALQHSLVLTKYAAVLSELRNQFLSQQKNIKLERRREFVGRRFAFLGYRSLGATLHFD